MSAPGRGWRLERGATPLSGGPDRPPVGVRFSVWAPRCQRLDLRLFGAPERRVPMARGADGVFTVEIPQAAAGMDYAYAIPDRGDRPDPVSRHQPHGPHGPSRIVDPDAFAWSDGAWRGRPLAEYLIYELHVGAFTPEGTFDAAAERLPYLVELGVTAVEIMPVAEFPGARNWGYDGVNLFAPQSSYGGPEAFKRLIDACHRHGLAVVLDVVYNHLGPDGNYLGQLGPYFSRRYGTPWGEAINFDGPDSAEVRRYFIDNALYWLTEFHVDALRLDAIHGIFDLGALHILDEMKGEVAAEMAAAGRQAWLIAESDLNDPRIISPRAAGGYGLDAQWSDDFHHSLFALLIGLGAAAGAAADAGAAARGGFAGYFADFGRIDDLRKAIAEGFVYSGRHSAYRRRRHGGSSAAQPGHKLVVYIQNHDQIANGAAGRRLARLVSPEAYKLAAAVLLCAPNIPLLFMGQEFAATTPFHYFTSHIDPALAQAIRDGRRQEFAHLGDPQWIGEWADPQAEETFQRSKLDWACLAEAAHAGVLQLYRDLIALRRQTPALANGRKDLIEIAGHEEQRWLTIARADPDGGRALVIANLGAGAREIPLPRLPAAFAGSAELALFTGAARYGGSAEPPRLDGHHPTRIDLPGWSAAIYRYRTT